MKAEADARWDYDAITAEVFHSQRRRRVVWDALKLGSFTSWDFNPEDDGRQKYIRSTIPLMIWSAALASPSLMFTVLSSRALS
ncbi:unnamed protein product [Clonostachys rosea f. rosea IK726]|uniref:Uncharacterized protein n=1 Tax=Clonostachys rosea f. rosea IK726 TaxID=1349383 RepID=A0ACA9UDQ6_BIOOC|nr:unnamed protein product [Clonostachys rosea f. rosea IK726]